MLAVIPLLFALAGLLMYVLATNAKLVELGRIVFFCGFLVFTGTLASHVVKLF